ncbi:MAG: hypothetical protein IT459_11740 [Planctomycetes bacterium]|nr:hypothetical protein [Planctomycetota bacterium]
MDRSLATVALVVITALPCLRAQDVATTPAIPLDATTPMELRNTRALSVEHRGRQALHLAPLEGHEHDVDQTMEAVLTGVEFEDGVIELDIAGARRAGYAVDNASAFKGFVGVSFRVRDEESERFYLRTENARLDDQVFRNRSTQYESDPDFAWKRLRDEEPGKYESYVELEPGAWTHVRIEVAGPTARLYVGYAEQPCLIVNDLKHGASRGKIALWARISSEAYFANLHVDPTWREGDGDRSLATSSSDAPETEPRADLDDVRFGTLVRSTTEVREYRGRPAIHLVPTPEAEGTDESMLALLADEPFRDGTIEVDVAGAPRPGAPPDSRGFIGVAFRTGEQGEWSEVFYLRPTNARCDDQVRRNRSTQYACDPDFPWHRLRRESPGKYESYVDLEPGAWTKMRIEVRGTTARLYVDGAEQPCLVVTDLKHGDGEGRVALWAHVETDAYFGEVRVTRG